MSKGLAILLGMGKAKKGKEADVEEEESEDSSSVDEYASALWDAIKEDDKESFVSALKGCLSCEDA